MTEHPEWWDPHSCQPYKLPKTKKPRTAWANLYEYLKILGTTAALSPAIAIKYAGLKPKPAGKMADMAGLSINAEAKWQNAHLEMVSELGVKNLLIRIPAWQLDQLDNIVQFMSKFHEQTFIVNILQSRESVTNPKKWANQLRIIFESASPVCTHFQISNAVNRSKWGCHHSGEALHLFKIADEVRSEFDGLTILGSSVIDFEPLISLRTLYNFAGYHNDICASLLYVNRRGSPYEKQYRYFNLQRKLRLNKAILSISNNTQNRLWITETNWPLLDTKPYTPNSGNPRSTVNEETQAEYLKQYFNIALQTGWVERVYWWQLINPGYGLVDHRGDTLRKMPSYYAFKSLFEDTTDAAPHDTEQENL